jgi:5'(3')-deoxyribonucleotidase
LHGISIVAEEPQQNMPTNKTVLLDMDGVLADFFTLAIERLNAHTGMNVSLDAYINAKTGWELENAYGISGHAMWKILEGPGDFWTCIKPYYWAEFLVEFAHTIGDVYIATSPRPNPVCVYQKLDWIERHLKFDLSKVIMGQHKHLMSRQDTILIDDSPKNIERFNQGEGRGILVPSNWNTPGLQYSDVCDVILRNVYPRN